MNHPKRLCPQCHAVLPKPERLMICGKHTRFAGAARYCARCQRWAINREQLTVVRMAPVWAELMVAA